MKIFLGTVLGTLLCCALAHGQSAVSQDGRSVVDGGPAQVAAQPSGVSPTAESQPVEDEIAWGKETDGLVANLRALTTAVKPGEPIEFEVRVKNVSKEEIFLLGHLEPSPATWVFDFGEWEWMSPQPSLPTVPLKPGDTASVRCLVATTRDSLTAEQKSRIVGNRWGSDVAPFRNVRNKKEADRLPEGVYRVRAASQFISARDQEASIETNTIEVRISDRGE